MDIQTKPYDDNVTIIRPKKEYKIDDLHKEYSGYFDDVVMFILVLIFCIGFTAIVCALIL